MRRRFAMQNPEFSVIDENLKRVRHKIEEAAVKAGRGPGEVRLMAVTKTVDPARVNHAIARGVELIGENRVQEYLQKLPRLHPCQRHLIGHLQRNKAAKIVGQVEMIQSLDSVGLARELGRLSVARGLTSRVLVEVNIGGEDAKFGFFAKNTLDAVTEMAQIPGIFIQGLMTVPPFLEEMSAISKFFMNMQQLFLDIRAKKIDNVDMRVLSMGMSGDFEAAVAAGSTLVRVGTGIFGGRA
jgi:pyridoxal phosphate enzyme (YggS family)